VMFLFGSNSPSTKPRSFVLTTSLQIFDIRRIPLSLRGSFPPWIRGQQMNIGWLTSWGRMKIGCLSICKASTLSMNKVMTSGDALCRWEIPPTQTFRPFLLRSHLRLLHTSVLHLNKIQKEFHLARGGSFSSPKLSDYTSTRMFPSATLLEL